MAKEACKTFKAAYGQPALCGECGISKYKHQGDVRSCLCCRLPVVTTIGGMCAKCNPSGEGEVWDGIVAAAQNYRNKRAMFNGKAATVAAHLRDLLHRVECLSLEPTPEAFGMLSDIDLHVARAVDRHRRATVELPEP